MQLGEQAPSVADRWLARLGQWLVTLGTTLQARVPAHSSAPIMQGGQA
jgi:hypothetical protein